jgi:hypothetical protein
MTPTLLYSQRLSACGCRGVPEGQHLPGCDRHRGAEAHECRRCGYRAATEGGCCAICGTLRDGIPPAPAAPMLLSGAELEHPFGPGIEAPERLHWLRTASNGEFRLDLWDTEGRAREVQADIAYRLCVSEGARWVLALSGEGFSAPPGHRLDSDVAVAALLRFLSPRPGEADPAHFERYSARQLAFVREHGEALLMWAAEFGQGGGSLTRRRSA